VLVDEEEPDGIRVDIDTYAVGLAAGDVLGGSVSGSGTIFSVQDPGGREVIGSAQDGSSLYPPSSPLPGGGNAVADHVAASNGRHYVSVLGGEGNYDLTLEVYRPGSPGRAPMTRRSTSTCARRATG
jgi:hypothetical protein